MKKIISLALLLPLFSLSQTIGNKNPFAQLFVNNATLTGHIYRDVNGNGTQNSGEPNLSSVDVLLNQSDGSFQIVTTNINGDWTALVSPGSTSVSLDQNDLPPIAGRVQTEGTDPNIVNAVAFQSTYAGTDGFFYVGTLTGHLYFDNNGNGTQNQATDTNMANVSISVIDAYGNIYNTITDALGNWSATVGSGLATVFIVTSDQDFPTGAIQTEGTNPTVVNVVQGMSLFTDNDGFFRQGTAVGHLYFDVNGNGSQEAGEPNMVNISISILDSLNIIHNLTTDNNGNWSVTLPIGTAIASIVTSSVGFPIGAVQTQGTNPITFTVTNNSTTTTPNCGFYNRGTLSGHLYSDLNNNGIQNGTEPNLANITILITESNGAVQSVVTNSLGNWTANVNSGSTISLIDISDSDFPLGSIQTQGTNPIISTVFTNQVTTTVNCGFFYPLDTDGDGVLDYVEITNGTNPNSPCSPTNSPGYTGYVATNPIWQSADCDGDGINNGTENTNNTDPYNPCSPVPLANNSSYVSSNPTWQVSNCDGDGLTNGQEIILGTNPFLSDTDGDGINDSTEVTNNTNPLNPCSPSHNPGYTGYVPTNILWQAGDCDGDGIPNGIEQNNGTDPYNPCSPLPLANNTNYVATNIIWQGANCDGDALTNGQENVLGTNPFLTDTDGDGISDSSEVTNNTNPLNPCSPSHPIGYIGYVATNTMWQQADCDGDGILNGSEYTNNTDPYNPCSPLPNANNTSYDATNPIWINANCDNDGLTNGQENQIGTNPFLSDSDGDGLSDSQEVTNTTNPLDPCSPSQSIQYTGFVSTNIIWQTADCDGDGISNGEEYNDNSNPYDPCDPNQLSGYSEYDPTNTIWMTSDCDGDGVDNFDEHTNGTNPYDPSDNGIKIYNAISPNGDGRNETLYIVGINTFTPNTLSIVNRWGIEVYNVKNYNNDFNSYSKGRLTIKEGEKLPSGTYFYKFTFTTRSRNTKVVSGYLYIN